MDDPFQPHSDKHQTQLALIAHAPQGCYFFFIAIANRLVRHIATGEDHGRIACVGKQGMEWRIRQHDAQVVIPRCRSASDLGVRQATGFRVFRLTNPRRVVIDVAH